MVSIADKLQEFCDTRKTNIEAGLVTFSGGKIRTAIPLENFQSAKFKDWARGFNSPDGGTPLGDSIRQASSMLAKSQAPHKHILVVTDGESNAGARPETVLRQMKAAKEDVAVYFVAFDVAARVFNPVKKEGATVVGAADETLLRVELDTIVGKKILLEAE
jgi:Mg-chelatase subunit ChlD